MHLNNKARVALLTTMLTAQAAHGEIEDNPGYRDVYTGLAAAHFTLLPASFVPGPIGAGIGLVAIGLDIGIKTRPATLVTADPTPVEPDSPDDCHYDFVLPQKESDYQNLFGFADVKLPASNWGAFSDPTPPTVGHANASVKLRVDNFYLNDWSTNDKTVVFPSGDHRINWEAATQLDPLIDVTIPLALWIIANQTKYGKAIFDLQTDPKTAARALEVGGLFLINAGISSGLIAAGQIDTNLAIDTAVHQQNRTFTVYDITPPDIEYNPPPSSPDVDFVTEQGVRKVVLEANSFGGERWSPYRNTFREWIDASDPCDQLVLVGNDAPFLLPLGDNTIEWEALDTGPVGGSNTGRATVDQIIKVQDTRAPILLAPPSRVIESDTAATEADFDLGTAVVFDVADPEPSLGDTIIPGSFPVDARTEIVWIATDASGNADSKSQWVTVKTPGSNMAPTVTNVGASTLTSRGVELTLTGSDSDILSGRPDPLMFDIVQPPANGFFVAPLLPYFIEDFRVKPNDTVGDILNTSNNPPNDLYDAFCGPGTPGTIPTDFVYQPEFVHVTDDGVSYVLDKSWRCNTSSTSAETDDRISKWSAAGALLDSFDVPSTVKRLTLDADGLLYYVQPEQNDLPMFLEVLDGDLNPVEGWKIEAPQGRMLAAKIDSTTGLIYATNKSKVYVYDSNDLTSGEIPALLGTLKNDEFFLSGAPSIAGSSSRGFNIEIDSAGFVYVVDSGDDRIHKFEPSGFDGSTFTPGAHVGWMGRCDSGPGCDDPNGRSFGFSCSDTTPCTVADPTGSLPGQFDGPIGIALDPEDTLYVTDYNNSRVQRFSVLGDFAGEAASVCDGSCFVLGDMGRPLDISVNSTQFFVLDRDRDLMHIFETAPFKDITEDSVIVEYASDNDFQGTDTFTFRANDGLVDSNLGTATIQVARDFRAPEAFGDLLTLDEDTPQPLLLLASDPDGIAGIDFNGLDTLTYTIVEGPNNGMLSGSGESRTYTPNQDFNGEDSIVFKVNDGRDDSNEATIMLTIDPVNDRPIVRFTDGTTKVLPKALGEMLEGKTVGTGVEAGLGYPVPLFAEFDDPDLGQAHFLQINWGDGTIDSANQNPPPDPDNPGDDPIITTAYSGTGSVIGEHVYLSEGSFQVDVNVIDENGAGSSGADAAVTTVAVIPMVDVALEAIPEDTELPNPGQPATLLIDVSNQPPESPVTALNATNVEFTGVLPEGVELVSFDTTKGTCSHLDDTTTCQLGTLAPDEVVTITIEMLPDINFDPATLAYEMNATLSEPDPNGDNQTVAEVPVKAQVLFNDSFE